jgi:hypothetical protein
MGGASLGWNGDFGGTSCSSVSYQGVDSGRSTCGTIVDEDPLIFHTCFVGRLNVDVDDVGNSSLSGSPFLYFSRSS